MQVAAGIFAFPCSAPLIRRLEEKGRTDAQYMAWLPDSKFLESSLCCAKVACMFLANGHNAGAGSVDNAIMSQHVAQKCMGEAAAAVMSQHVAQQSVNETFDNQVFYRYF